MAIKLNSKGKALVYPAFPQLKIWPSAVKGLDYNLSSLPTLFPGSRKRVIRQPEAFSQTALPLGHIFILEKEKKIKITKLKGVETFFNLARFFPCPTNILQGTALGNHFQQCQQLLSKVNLSKLYYPQDFQTLKKLIDEIKTWVDIY